MTPPQAYLRCKQRWPQKDGYAWDIMRKDPRTALLFAQKIIGGRFPDGEKAIAQDSESSLEYALLIKKRFPQGEPSIASNPNHAIEYAEKVLKGPFPACEPALSCNPASACAYATRILRRPYPPGEAAIYQSWFAAPVYLDACRQWQRQGHMDPFVYLAFDLRWAEAKGFHTRIPEHSRGTGLSKEWIQLAHTLLSPNMELHEAIEVCRSSLLAQTPILPSLDFTP